MNAVLYTHQLEPITVVDIPMFLWDRLSRGETISLAVVETLKIAPDYDRGDFRPMKVVSIFGEKLKRRQHETLMLFTHDEENALLLQAEFLPGQRGELQNRERSAFANGFLRALQDFGA